jgi:hypothetical protein
VLLALGGVLLVAGALYPRLSSLEGPGFKVGLAGVAPEVKEQLTERARREAAVRGKPDEADAIAEQAEKVLLDRLQPFYGLHSHRSRTKARTDRGLALRLNPR